MLKIIALLAISCSYALASDTVAKTIYAEARGEGEIGMLAVADVILVRANETGKTAEQVCLEHNQFSCWNSPIKVKFNDPTWITCLKLQDNILARVPIKNVVGGANHYCTFKVNPKWAEQDKLTCVIGHHRFYKL